MNGKKVLRIMKKYNLVPMHYWKSKKKNKNTRNEENVKPNLVNRKFDVDKENKIWTTDITYLIFKGSRAYLSTILDLYDRKVVAYKISKHNDIKLVTDTLNEAIAKRKDVSGVILHSDQGVHYTSPKFHNLLKKYNIQQSMSRRGNCWDNAPQESYFGHMKDELNLDTCFTFRDVCNEIKDYIEYYNNYRYQWNLKKMTPVQYRNHLFESIA